MQSESESARRALLSRLAALPLFAGLDTSSLIDLADAMQWLLLPGGETLMSQGEESDALYVLLYGRLAAMRRGADGQLRDLGAVAPGECVGEVGLITRQARSATVVALRDSELLRLPRAAFERLVAMHPAAMLNMARIALKRTGAQAGAPATPHCFALLPAHPGLDLAGFAADLARALGSDPARALVNAEQARGRDPGWFNARESRAEYLIYVGNDDSAWQIRCLRQCDCLLLLCDGRRLPDPRHDPPLPSFNPHVPQHLLLLQPDEPRPGSTGRWRAQFPNLQAHYHVRGNHDLARAARRLAGRATGLVLSGGGARGFAHLGVVQALRDCGHDVDYIGGASIGAVLGAGVAADWPREQLFETFRHSFVRSNPLSDWTLPLVALRTGRVVSQRLREAYGERDIEDLPLPFFAVSSNLTDGALLVHESGSLWKALRASCAIPGVLPPVLDDGRVLVDGGVIDNLPVAEMRKRLGGDIIAVDVGGNYRLHTELQETELPGVWQQWPELRQQRRPSLAQILLRAGMVNSAATVQRRRKQTKLLLKPELPGIDLLEWREFDRAVELGYRYAMKRLREPAKNETAAAE
jgi:NTE family protein